MINQRVVVKLKLFLLVRKRIIEQFIVNKLQNQRVRSKY